MNAIVQNPESPNAPWLNRPGLTPQMLKCLEFIRATIAKTGSPPNYREIAEALGRKSKSGINRLVCKLETRGYIVRMPKLARSIALIEEPLFKCPKCGHQFQSNQT